MRSSPPTSATVADVEQALDAITGGRISEPSGPENPWRVIKDSGLPGKAVAEAPGLVLGEPDQPVRRLAVAMSLTEHHIELAHALEVDAIVAHHPVADAASSGGVALRDYLPRYGLSVLECHEAFHGLHPGIAYLHGHDPFFHTGALGGVHGKIVSVGRPLPGVNTLGDLLKRLRSLLERSADDAVLAAETTSRKAPVLYDSATTPGMRIVVGSDETPVGGCIVHAFPHTGFGPEDLDEVLAEHPTAGTLLLSISGIRDDDALARHAASRGLAVVVGSSHASEILENGLPLAHALECLLPTVEVILFRDRVVALPLEVAAPGSLDHYRRTMGEHLLARAYAYSASLASTCTPPPLQYTSVPAGDLS